MASLSYRTFNHLQHPSIQLPSHKRKGSNCITFLATRTVASLSDQSPDLDPSAKVYTRTSFDLAAARNSSDEQSKIKQPT